MDFKIQKVSIVKAPPVLPGTSNSQRKLNNKEYHSHSKEGHTKPPVPGGKPHGVHLERNTAGSGATSSTDHNQNKDRNQREYCYAGVEFRPLHVTDEEAVSIAIVPPNNDISSRAADKQKREILPYQEVQIPSGDFDKINTESILIKTNQTSTSTNNSALAAFTADIQDMTHAYYDDNWDSQQASSSRSSGKKPPPMPKPYSKTKDSVDGPSTGKKRIPPPMPKPYNSRKEEVEKPNPPEGELIQDAVYAVVDKSSKQRHPTRAKDDMADEVEDNEPPPPLPSRPDFEAQEDLKRSQEDMANQDLPEVAEKSAKGMGILKTIKKHIRQASDGSGSSRNEELKQKSASTEELTKPDDSAAKPVRAYLVTDIVNQPSTKMFGEPEMYETASDVRDEEDSHSSSNDLPEGWQEVKDSGDTYYWHVASGTTQWQKPRKLETTPNNSSHRPNVEQSKPKHKPELKTVTSFPVHSMGWMELEESQVAPHNMSDTIAECISNLARQRKDLWKTSETWGEGKDLRLLLETDNLKLVDVQTKATLLVQPISKMRVWGAGREELKDFAYVARDQSTGKHKCHVFRCHGSISGRAIHNKLHEMCNKILAEKKKARENQQQNSSSKQWSDILNTPPKPSLKDQAGFNVKPVAESKKSFSAKYIGKVEVPKPSGIDVLHKAINIAINAGDFQKWRTCLIEITVSSVRSTECLSQQIIAEDRIKFVSFIGVAKDVKYCGYITSAEQHPPFICHVFQCIPNAASFTKALEEACRLRLQSCLDTNPELAQKLITVEADKGPGKESKPPVGLKGFLGKLAHQTKLGGKKANAEPVQGNNPLSSDRNRALETTSSASHSLIKYYGHQPVSVGTGPTAIKEAVKTAQGTTLQISILNIGPEGITLDDSIKSGISRKHIPSERISYCGLASDRVHFGVVESQGGGKFICHVFQEYKIPVNTIVEAINRVL